jgi:hypothetical protein
MSASTTDPADPRERVIRAQLGGGVALPDRLRQSLERAYGAHLDGVRLHDDDTADALAETLDADAFATGADVFFRAGALRLDSDAGVELVAHEVAHVVQQASGRLPGETQAAETEAVDVARSFAAGRLPDRPLVHRAVRVQPEQDLVLQRHSSWEHRMLGDVRTQDFGTIAGGGQSRKDYLRRVQQFLLMWASNPDVSAERIVAAFPDIRPLTLRVSGLVVTYGELNTLADYVASPAELDTMPKVQLLPLLQQVRQEGYAWVTWVIEEKWLDQEVVFGGFAGSVADTLGSDTADALWETHKLDAFTTSFGTRGTNSYSALLSRNACHFAPHSWYRWEQFYLQARAFALQASRATGARRDRLTNLAWIHHGYADHFLHDSFAAGHLVNKTLVMQWYLDWVGNTWTPVPDWDLVQFMTLARQPDLAGRPLYSAFNDPAARGEVRDPQTASEHWSLARRTAVSGVRADGSPLGSSYKRWLAFLGTGVVQLASNTVHDHFNASSLWVSSQAHPQAFQLYGDNTMIRGGEGYQIASATAQLSQRSIVELLAGGHTDVTSSDIAARFPSRVHDTAALASSQSLEQWAYGYQGQASAVFDGLKNRLVGSIRTRLAPVNIDVTGGWRWDGVTGSALDVAVGGSTAWSLDASHLDGQGNGPVQSWDQTTSKWVTSGGAGVRIAVDGSGGRWVVNAAGDSFYSPFQDDNAWQKGQRAVVAGVEGLVDVAAGTDGSAWALAKAAVAGGHQLMRGVPGSGTHSWRPVSGGATAVSVGPDGSAWVVNDRGSVLRLSPGTGADPFVGDGATWVDVTPPGRKATDVALSVGPLLCAWVTTDAGIFAWNGRGPDRAPSGGRLQLDWEDVGGVAVRVAAGGAQGRPWVVNQQGSINRLVAGATATAAFTTADAGKVTGTARATGGSLFQGESLSINGSTDLSQVVVGNSGARVYSIRLDRSSLPGVFYTLFIDGQGPAGLGSGSMYVYLEDEGGFTEYKQFYSREHHTLTIDYNGTKAGIRRISWSDGDDPARPR